jgi:Ca2+-binding RTX toxin-like protein
MAGSWLSNGTQYSGDDTNEVVNGTTANEGIWGRGGDDQLFGGGGNDYIEGGTGSDRIEGGAGNDTLTDTGTIAPGFQGLIGRDTIFGGEGDDEIRFESIDTSDIADGGAGHDLLRLWLIPPYANPPAFTPVNFTLGPGGAASVLQLGGVNTITVQNIERVFIFTGNGNDYLVGAAGNDALWAGDGDDALYGGDGDDEINGGTGVQDIRGGGGIDRASFDLRAATQALTIRNVQDLSLGVWGHVRGIEVFDEIRTGSGADTFVITQSRGIEIISGDGADRITVGNGGSNIEAGRGDDIITTGAGYDEVDGGEGGNIVRLGGGGDRYLHASRLDTGNEQVWGEDGDDLILTASGDDRAYGGAGNDNIYTGRGNDLGLGNEGNDTLRGEDGADTLYGGLGNDVLDGDQDINATSDEARPDVLYGGEGDDTLRAGQGADQLFGGAGNDRLMLVIVSNEALDAQTDLVEGGAGIDTLDLFASGATVAAGLDIALAPDFLLQIGGQTVASVEGVEALWVTAYGGAGHRLTGGAQADRFQTGAGDDRLVGGSGNDTLGGDVGNDTLLAGTGNDSVQGHYLGGVDHIDLGEGDDAAILYVPWSSLPIVAGRSTVIGGAGRDVVTIYTSDREAGFDGTTLRIDGVEVARFFGVEEVRLLASGSRNDTLSGGPGNDSMRAEGGDDRLTGNGGNDTLDGGAGNDLLRGGAGNDLLTDSAGADTLMGEAGDDILTLRFDALADSLFGGTGNDQVFVGGIVTGVVTMAGSLATSATLMRDGVLAATLAGVEALQLALSGSGNDRLLGGTGNDTFSTSLGADSVFSGAGDDYVSAQLDAGGVDLLDLGAGTGDVAGLGVSGLTGGVQAVLQPMGAETLVRVGGALAAVLRGVEALRLSAGSGDDTVGGGAGADTAALGAGANRAAMGGGDDQVSVQIDAGVDTLAGGAGNDLLQLFGSGAAYATEVAADGTVTARLGATVVVTATGMERMSASGGSDTLTGDRLGAGAGADTLFGGQGNDTLLGWAGDDLLYGGSEDDAVVGGLGNDTLYGETGADTLTGGPGADRFVFFSTTSGADRVTDFAADDVLRIAASSFGGGLVAGGAAPLVQGAAPVPAGLGGVFLFATGTGELWWDIDGTGGNLAVLVATLRAGTAAASLTAAQMELY